MSKISIDREVVEQALEALKSSQILVDGAEAIVVASGASDARIRNKRAEALRHRESITDLRTALYESALDGMADDARAKGLGHGEQRVVMWQYQHRKEPDGWKELVPRIGQTIEVALEEIQGYRSWDGQPQYEVRALVVSAPSEQGAQRQEPQPPADWEVFNSGASVAGGITYAEALDYLTPSRLERGWSAVCVVNKDNIGKVTRQEPVQEPVVTKVSANGSFLHPAWDRLPVGASLYTNAVPQPVELTPAQQHADELLEALQAFLQDGQDYTAIRDKARAVISKATGQEGKV